MITVAMSWMTTLLSREMWLGDVLRLWGKLILGIHQLTPQTHTLPRTTCSPSTAMSASPSLPRVKSKSTVSKPSADTQDARGA
jgi:hypothetical protein